MNVRIVIISIISAALAIARISGHKGEAFQAIAHIFVGGLFAAWGVDRTRKFELVSAIVLSIVETSYFIYFSIFN